VKAAGFWSLVALVYIAGAVALLAAIVERDYAKATWFWIIAMTNVWLLDTTTDRRNRP
jgi:hypothetical protein